MASSKSPNGARPSWIHVSNHPVDTKLITERLFPRCWGRTIDDLLIVRLTVRRCESGQSVGFRVMQLGHDLVNEQFDAEMERPFRCCPASKLTSASGATAPHCR